MWSQFKVQTARVAFLSVALAGASFLFSGEATAQNVILSQLYGKGVHAYFDGDFQAAHGLLTEAIEGKSRDPRAYYFRAMAYHQLGRPESAAEDMAIGAKLEVADVNQFYPVSRSLERVQGTGRVLLEKARRDARMEQYQDARDRRNRRFGDGQAPAPRQLPADNNAAPADGGFKAEGNPFGDDPASDEGATEGDDPFGDDSESSDAGDADADAGDDPFGDDAASDDATSDDASDDEGGFGDDDSSDEGDDDAGFGDDEEEAGDDPFADDAADSDDSGDGASDDEGGFEDDDDSDDDSGFGDDEEDGGFEDDDEGEGDDDLFSSSDADEAGASDERTAAADAKPVPEAKLGAGGAVAIGRGVMKIFGLGGGGGAPPTGDFGGEDAGSEDEDFDDGDFDGDDEGFADADDEGFGDDDDFDFDE